jgi:hypothetical protein
MNPHTARAIGSIAAGTGCAAIGWAAPEAAVVAVLGLLGSIYLIWGNAP